MKYRFIMTTVYEIEAEDVEMAKARFIAEHEQYREHTSLEVYDENKTEVHAEFDNLTTDNELLGRMFD